MRNIGFEVLTCSWWHNYIDEQVRLSLMKVWRIR